MELSSERTIWLRNESYPDSLNADEIAQPLSVIADFYQRYSLPKAKQLLWTLTRCTVSRQYLHSTDHRLELYQFTLQLEKMFDVGWLINQSDMTKVIHSEDPIYHPAVKKLCDSDFFSFLTIAQTKNIRTVLKSFFKLQGLHWWKTRSISIMQKSILDPYEILVFPIHEIESFPWFIKGGALLEALYLFLENPKLSLSPEINSVAWFNILPRCNSLWPDPGDFISMEDSLAQGLLFLCHVGRYNIACDSASTSRLYSIYDTLIRLCHQATTSSARDQNALNGLLANRNLGKIWSAGRYTRFLTDILAGSPHLKERKTYKKHVSPQKQIDHVLLVATWSYAQNNHL